MKHLQKIPVDDIVFLDIETARLTETLQKDSPLWDSWEYHMKYKNDPRPLEDSYEQDAALHPEFARIICITVGTIRGGKMNLTTFYDKDEKQLLTKFNKALTQFTAKKPKAVLAGHAVIDFDLPFIMKRCIVNQVTMHTLVDVGGLKPWEVTTLDTKLLWKGTGSRTSSLINIAVALGIPSPKDDISGADVGRVYYEEGDAGLVRIVKYCEKDVVTTARAYLRLAYQPDVTDISVSEVNIEEEPNIVELIQNQGYITDELEGKLLDSVKNLNPLERAYTIEVVSAALAHKGGVLSEELKTKILE